jgi:hypothetical protein
LFVLVPLAEYEYLIEEYDDSDWTDEERDLAWIPIAPRRPNKTA